MTTLHDFITATTGSYAAEIERLISDATVGLDKLRTSEALAVEHHEVERDTIIKWANDLAYDRIAATRRLFIDLISEAEARIKQLELVKEFIDKGEMLPAAQDVSDFDASTWPMGAAPVDLPKPPLVFSPVSCKPRLPRVEDNPTGFVQALGQNSEADERIGNLESTGS